MASETVRRAAPSRIARALVDGVRRGAARFVAYFAERDPTIAAAFGPALVVSALLYVRSPFSNYIFDEQEALLANPFVNGKVPFRDVLTRDFWGLPHDRSIGSYRPLPNVVWRAVWDLGPMFHHPWALHWINIVVHAVNAACVARIAFGFTRDRPTAWLAGVAFAGCAVLTEAVTGVVGIADVFGALGLLLAVLALEASLPNMALGVLGAVTLGLFSKESTLVAIPIVAWVALLTAPVQHSSRPWRVVRALVALTASVTALVIYTATRLHFFPSEPPADLSASLTRPEPWVLRGFHAFLRWFQQPKLPQDPINNPLILADIPHRVAGALGVYASGVGQVLLPLTLSGDYSFAAEPIPAPSVERAHGRGRRAAPRAAARRRSALDLGTRLGAPGPPRSRESSDRARDRGGVDTSRVFPALEHPRHAPDGARGTVLVSARRGVRARARRPVRDARAAPEVVWFDAGMGLFRDGLPRFSGRASPHARARLHGRPGLLARDRACRSRECEGASQLRRDARGSRQTPGAARRKPRRHGTCADLAHGPRLLRRHALPAESRRRSVAVLPRRADDGPERPKPSRARSTVSLGHPPRRGSACQRAHRLSPTNARARGSRTSSGTS